MTVRFDSSNTSRQNTAGYRSESVGATLVYGPKAQRPDLLLAAQFLVDDLRGGEIHIAGLRVNADTLRLRLEGAELALALSSGPLPLRSLRGLRRPVGIRLPSPSAEMSDPQEADAAEALLTDLGTIRVARALSQHRVALGVLLTRRGTDGPADLVAALQLVLHTLSEAAPPALVLWQRSGMVLTASEFACARRSELEQEGRPSSILARLDRPAADRNSVDRAPVDPEPGHDSRRGVSRPEGIQDTGDAPGRQVAPTALVQGMAPTSRAQRAAGRSVGRLFRKRPATAPIGRTRQQHFPAPVWQGEKLAAALRDSPPPTANGGRASQGRLAARMILGLWFALVLPDWSALKMMLLL